MIDRLLKLAISLVVSLGDRLTNLFGGGRYRAGTCVVINYHTVTGENRTRFARQLDLLTKLATPIAAAKEISLEQGRRYVAVTVDDVFESFVSNGLPELCQRNIPVTVFPPTGYLGRNSAWADYGGENKVGETVASADKLKEMTRLANVDFGSHGVMHADLALLPETEAGAELRISKASLEGILGRAVTAFSFPYGSYGPRELQLAGQAGYKFLFDSVPAQMSGALCGGLIGRVDVQPGDWEIEFKLKVRGAYRWIRQASALKRQLRARLGRSAHS